MARRTPIKEIAELSEDEKIMLLSGTAKTVYDRSEGENEHGEWSFQSLMLSDGTGTIKVKIKDHPEIPKKWKGRPITIECTHSENHGWNGVKAVDDEYKGKTSRIVMVTKAGVVQLAEESNSNDRDEAPKKEVRKQKDGSDDVPAAWEKVKIHVGATGMRGKTLDELSVGELAWLQNNWLARADHENSEDAALVDAVIAFRKSGKKKNTSDELPLDKVDERKHTNGNGNGHHVPEAGSDEAIREVKRALSQRSNLYLLCTSAVANIIVPQWESITGDKMTPEQYQSTIASIFIGAEKAGMMHRLPFKPLPAKIVPDESSKSAAK